MTQEVKPQDHPDFVGGWTWTELEMRWIEKRISEAIEAEREACAKICKKHAGVYEMLEHSPAAQGAWAACIDNWDAIKARDNT
jgi:hypothetical protein